MNSSSRSGPLHSNPNNRRIVQASRGGSIPQRNAMKFASTSNPFPVDERGEIIPGEYSTPAGHVKIKKIEKAKAYDVVSVARSMNDNFAGKVKELFDPERQAVEEAIQTGLYISWRPIHKPYDTQDCQRVSSQSRCFCGHHLQSHEQFTGYERVLKCLQMGCKCKAFQYMINRPEEAGEFWARKRRDFDPASYRGKCRCKHTSEEHAAYPPPHRCQIKACGCTSYYSSWVCAACDQHWNDHQTVMETEKERKQAGRPVGDEWYPFAELPDLKQMVLTGEDSGVDTLIDALPPSMRQKALAHRTSIGNDAPALVPNFQSNAFGERRNPRMSSHRSDSSSRM